MRITPIHLFAAGVSLLALEFLLPGFVALWFVGVALSLGCAAKGGRLEIEASIREQPKKSGAGTCQPPDLCFSKNEPASVAAEKNEI